MHDQQAGLCSYLYYNNITATVKSTRGHTPSRLSALDSIMVDRGPRKYDCLPTTLAATDSVFFDSFALGRAMEF